MQEETVGVAVEAPRVPPATFERVRTVDVLVDVVVLVSGAEFIAELKCQPVTFRQTQPTMTKEVISAFTDC